MRLYNINLINWKYVIFTEKRKKSLGSDNLSIYDYFYSDVPEEQRAVYDMSILTQNI